MIICEETQAKADDAYRPEGHGPLETHIPRDVWPRYVMGLFPRPRGYVFREVSTKASGISRGSAELQAGYRSSDAGNKLAEESKDVGNPFRRTIAESGLGPNLDLCEYHVPPYYNTTAHNNIFSGSFSTFGPPPAINPLTSNDTKENDCDTVQTRPGLPGDSTASMAENKRTADG